jgi:hypothetical protein
MGSPLAVVAVRVLGIKVYNVSIVSLGNNR